MVYIITLTFFNSNVSRVRWIRYFYVRYESWGLGVVTEGAGILINCIGTLLKTGIIILWVLKFERFYFRTNKYLLIFMHRSLSIVHIAMPYSFMYASWLLAQLLCNRASAHILLSV